MATSRPSLSVCCCSDLSARTTAAALAPWRPLASEILLATRGPVNETSHAEFRGLADQLVDASNLTSEQTRHALSAAAAGDWILHVNADEAPTAALLASIEDALRRADLGGWRIQRAWLTPDGQASYAGAPWWPDAPLLLHRRGAQPADLGERRTGLLPGFLLVAACALRNVDERERAILHREIVERGGPQTLREARVLRLLPERVSDAAERPLEASARAAVAHLIPGSPRRRAWQRVLRRPQRPRASDGAQAPADAGGPLEFIGEPRTMAARQPCVIPVRVRNTTSEAWTSDVPEGTPGHFVSYHWHCTDGAVLEGRRTALPGTVQPGEETTMLAGVDAPSQPGTATLRLGIVHEFVEWLGEDAELTVDVIEPPALPVRREIRPSGAEIPKVIHRIWLGDRPMPEAHVRYGQTWERLHPGWQMRLWTDADAPLPAHASRARSIAEAVDLVRIEVLRQHGGVYVDTDIECLRPIDDLLAGVEAFAAYEEPGRLCNALMGAVPGHRAFDRLAELAKLVVGHGTYPQSLATVFTTFVLESFPEVTLFGPERFYPRLWDGRINTGDDPPYADHHWAVSWLEGAAHP